MEHIVKFIQEFEKLDYFPNYPSFDNYGTNPVVMIDSIKYLMFSSNNYLSLSNDKRVIRATYKSLKKNGLGPGGSRFLCGNIKILNDLEKSLSNFIGVEDVITFPTGYMANMSAISILISSFFNNQPHNINNAIIFSDSFNHGTLVDGIKISGAKKVIFPHLNNVYLENELKKYPENHPKLIVTESIYSMDGDVSDLQMQVKLAKKYKSLIMIDDAHGVGILGDNGGGALKHFQLEGQVDLIMGSADKALGGMGGYLGGNRNLINYCRIAARPYIFSSSVSALMAGGLLKVIELCQKEKFRRLKLFESAESFRKKLQGNGFQVMGNFNLPVLPIYIGDQEICKNYSKFLFKKKIFLPPIVWPAIPQNSCRLRLTLMYDHKKEHLDYLLKQLIDAKKEFE